MSNGYPKGEKMFDGRHKEEYSKTQENSKGAIL